MKLENINSNRQSGTATVAAPGGAVEPWFTVLLLALVPLVGALFVPAPWQFALHVLGGGMCAAGLVLLVRHEMAVRRQRNVTDR